MMSGEKKVRLQWQAEILSEMSDCHHVMQSENEQNNSSNPKTDLSLTKENPLKFYDMKILVCSR
jgi:hypothetical protein